MSDTPPDEDVTDPYEPESDDDDDEADD